MSLVQRHEAFELRDIDLDLRHWDWIFYELFKVVLDIPVRHSRHQSMEAMGENLDASNLSFASESTTVSKASLH